MISSLHSQPRGSRWRELRAVRDTMETMATMEEVSLEAAVEHRDFVRRFLLRLVHDETLAEDLVQETFLRAERTQSPHRGEASERSWLCAIALNLLRDHYRARERNPIALAKSNVDDLATPCSDPEQSALETEMSACIDEFVLQLPSPQCDVVALHDAAGLTHPEIGVLLEISEANSRVILHRGRKALRELLEDGCVVSFDGEGTPCERRPDGSRGGSKGGNCSS